MKNHTDLGQSKKLAEILQLEGADMYYSRDETTYAKTLTKYDITHANVLYGSCDIQYFNICGWTPCWSLSALFDMLPKFIGDYGKCLYYDVDGYHCVYMDDDGNFMLTIQETKADNSVDACYDMITNLHKLSLI